MTIFRNIDNNHIDKLDYLIVFLALCISGNPLFIYSKDYMFIGFAALFGLLCELRKTSLINKDLRKWLLLFGMLFFLQLVFVDKVSIPADVNFISKILLAFFVASLLGVKFREVYFRVMVTLSIISIPLFLLNLLLDMSFGLEFDRYYTIFLYNQIIPSEFDQGIRNASMFWEPGAFQGYLMLIPIMFFDKLKNLWASNRLACIVLVVAILTTKSTTAYMTVALFFLMYYLTSGTVSLCRRILIVSAGIAIFVFYVWNMDFMGGKIMKQYEDAQNLQAGDVSWDRFAVMQIDFLNIKRSPLVGNGFLDESRYGTLGEFMHGAGNGFTGSMNMFGIPFILLYLISVPRHLRFHVKNSTPIIMLTLILLLFGEYFLNYPMFWSLLFVKLPEKNETNCSSTYRT